MNNLKIKEEKNKKIKKKYLLYDNRQILRTFIPQINANLLSYYGN